MKIEQKKKCWTSLACALVLGGVGINNVIAAVMIADPDPSGILDSEAHLILDFTASGGGFERFDIAYSSNDTLVMIDLFDIYAGQSVEFDIATDGVSTGMDMSGLNPKFEVTTSGPERGYEVINYSFGNFLSRVDYNGVSGALDESDFSPSWVLWVEDDTNPGNWTTAGSGIDQISVADGGWYAAVFSTGFPGSSPVVLIPEPEATGLVLLGLAALAYRRRRS